MVRYYRKIIRVRAEDSPNVKVGIAAKQAGKTIPKKLILPGVLPYEDYVKRRATWDLVRQCIGLDGMFYEGAEVLMYPPDWLNLAEARNDSLYGQKRYAEAIGVDPAEGGDSTTIAIVDPIGLISLLSKKTPDTNEITRELIYLMRRYGVLPEKVAIDRGGGGKQIADQLRSQGYNVQTVPFGQAIVADPQYGVANVEEMIDEREEKYVYVNRRAQMYHALRLLLDPNSPEYKQNEGQTFALPAKYTELRRQLSLIPFLFDREGRIRMLPKSKKNNRSMEACLKDILGCSPDEADALVLAVFAMQGEEIASEAGAMW